MKTFNHCLLIAVATFLFATAGCGLHALFHIVGAGSGDLIRSISALIGTLFSIVLGLLVSSSYAAFNSHQSDFNALAAAAANIDLLLKQFPEDAKPCRTMLKGVVLRVLNRYWPNKRGVSLHELDYKDLLGDIEALLRINTHSESFRNVTRDDLNAIRQYSNNFITIQSNIIRSLSNQIPSLLLVIVFGWACLLFFLYGILNGGDTLSFFILCLGAVAIASANFLILELTHPCQGIFKVSRSPFDLLLESLDKEEHATPDDLPAPRHSFI
ncbi:bestrophin-like domain [Chromobacterium paludis]|uniref:DUF4239 domain-containing protein n=1 Tax=Chromobacterium paludis TaxID=2605945 RepID=A0A5C1DGF5_9NEIS|nr:DUF4239 domain-containing protein [Chromobacterium paludis]QEL55633.1 DUF4239 domain-containing protein [Chromobacterium paludis]